MAELIYGWVGANNILDFLKCEFTSENDQKKLNSLLNFKIQTKLNDKDIKPSKGINKWDVDLYNQYKTQKTYNYVTLLYKVQYSAYDKINRLQKFVDIINYKYAVNLKINFYYNGSKYTYILYFNNSPNSKQRFESISNEKIKEFNSCWQRIEHVFKYNPSINVLN